MLPTLWYLYDETSFRKNKRSFRGEIGAEVLSRYAPLFRIVNMFGHTATTTNATALTVAGARAIDIHQARMIRRLTMGSDRFAYNLDLFNGCLCSLDLTADRGDGEPEYIPTDPVPVVSRLTSLQHLSLRKYVLDHADLAVILHRKPRLQSLELHGTLIRGALQLSATLSTVSRLCLEYCTLQQSTLITLLQTLPSLRSLSLYFARQGIEGLDSAAIGRQIRESCPKLTALHLCILFGGESADEHFFNLLSSQFSNNNNNNNHSSSNSSSSSISKLTLTMNQLWPWTMKELTRRRDHLVHVSLKFARRFNGYATLMTLVQTLYRTEILSVSGPRNDREFANMLRRSIQNNHSSQRLSASSTLSSSSWSLSWMGDELQEQMRGDHPPLPGQIFLPVPSGWSMRDMPNIKHGRVLKIQLFDIWLLEGVQTMTHLKEVHINGWEYVRV
ncbi:hypothetical protein EDD11_001274 [Mortierella claussenii]|nr:hypothetical protein EDD11_001274 [Mortierella claussenii]